MVFGGKIMTTNTVKISAESKKRLRQLIRGGGETVRMTGDDDLISRAKKRR